MNSATRCSWDSLDTGGCAMNGSFPALELTHHRGASHPRQLLAPDAVAQSLPRLPSACATCRNSLNASRGERSKPHRWAFLARARARARQGACRERLVDRGCQPRVRGKIAVRLTVAAEARAHAFAAGLAEPGAGVG